MGLRKITPATGRVASVAELRSHLRVDFSDDDNLLLDLEAAAEELLAELANRSLLPTTWRLTLDSWPRDRVIRLPRGPLRSVASITYTDHDGDVQTLDPSTYRADSTDEVARIVEAVGASWPNPLEVPGSITVQYVAGYDEPGATGADVIHGGVPARAKHAIRLLVAHYYELREPVVLGASPAEIPSHLSDLISSLAVREAV